MALLVSWVSETLSLTRADLMTGSHQADSHAPAICHDSAHVHDTNDMNNFDNTETEEVRKQDYVQ